MTWWNNFYTFPGEGELQVSTDGGQWDTLWGFDYTYGGDGRWHHLAADLSNLRGQSIWIRFMTYVAGRGYWVVDEVQVTVQTGSCILRTSTPTVTGTPPTVTQTRTPTHTPTETPIPTPTTHYGYFQDVPPGHTFFNYVQCMGWRAIISGYPCGGPGEPCAAGAKPYYRPANAVTRGQVAKMIAGAARFNEQPPSSQQTFEDVGSGSTFWRWIEVLAGRGIIGGYLCGGPFEPCVSPTNRPYFRPDTAVTRGQLAKMGASAAGWNETPTGQTFQDVAPGHTFYLWIERSVGRGIVSGYPCGGPSEPCVPRTTDPTSGLATT